MSDTNNVLAVLAAALAPYIVQHINGNGGNPPAQAGGTFGSPQTAGAPNTAFGGTGTAGGAVAQTQQAQNAQQGGGMFGLTGGATGQQAQAEPQVTPDMIQSLLAPLVQNEQVKNALMAQLREMGIENLPDATPAQLPELYKRFKEVDRQAREAGLIGGGAAPAGTPNLI